MKKLLTISLLVASTLILSCNKEKELGSVEVTTLQKDGAYATSLFEGTTSMKYNCIPAYGNQCDPTRMGGCLVMYPPSKPWLWEEMNITNEGINITLHEPAHTNAGATGIQMVIGFNQDMGEFGDGYFMHSTDLPAHVYHENATELGYASIDIIPDAYQIQYNDLYPHGYVVVDCKALAIGEPLTIENIGDYHNAALFAISDRTSNLSTLGSLDNFDEYMSILNDFHIENGLTPYANGLTQSGVGDILTQVGNKTFVNNLYLEEKISLNAKNELDFLFGNLEAANSASQALHLFPDFIPRIYTAGVSEDERNMLLATASVASSSIRFWSNAYDNTANPWYDVARNTAPSSQGTGIKKWWWVVVADCAGAVVGGLGGVPAGPAGIAAGAFMVGVAASAETANIL